MLHRSTLQLLRFHFSFFLLPVYLFALSQVPVANWTNAVIVFIILHLLVYPASNGYNSYMDRDKSPIGGLQNPMQPTRELFWITVTMDVVAVAFSLLVSTVFSVGILFYILASRAYSYRGIRLKKYPVTGFLTVFIFQGALIFFIVFHSCNSPLTMNVPVVACIIASSLIGALYPLTQIYQHNEDKKDGVITISYMLGKRGSFVFSGVLFSIATALLYKLFGKDEINHFYLWLFITLPVVLFFCYWMIKVWRDNEAADFKHSLLMNVIATFFTTIYFMTLILMRQFE